MWNKKMGMGFEIISKYSDEMMNIIFFFKT